MQKKTKINKNKAPPEHWVRNSAKDPFKFDADPDPGHLFKIY